MLDHFDSVDFIIDLVFTYNANKDFDDDKSALSWIKVEFANKDLNM